VQVPGRDIEKEILSQTVPICQACAKIARQSKPKSKKKRKRRSWEDDDESEDDGKLPPYVMKPSITFFGEKLSSRFDRKLLADRDKVDLLLVIGTSLNVAPVSEIICHIPHSVPQILINKAMVKHAQPDIILLGMADEIVASLACSLGWEETRTLSVLPPQLSDDNDHHRHIHHYPGSDEAPEERLILDLPLAKSLKLGPEPECPFDLDFQYKRSDPASKHTEGTKPAMLASPLKNRLIDIKAVA